jgi:hypothetical protein
MELFSPVTRLLKHLGPKLLFVLLVSFAVLLLGGFYLGRHSGYRDVQTPVDAAKISQLQLADLREALDIALGELQMLRTGHEVDSQAIELLRSEMAAEKQRTAELEEGLGFYRSMLVSDDPEKGLDLHEPELMPGDKPGLFAYRIFVQQKDREFEMVEGALTVEVFGIREGEPVSYPLVELSENFGVDAATLHFRYFQSIEGNLALPEGFLPKGIILVARTNKPRETEIREEYPWELQERFINVGP